MDKGDKGSAMVRFLNACERINPTNPLAVAENIEALVEAATERVANGHNDPCRIMLCRRPCSCGHDDLSAILTRIKEDKA